MREHDWQQKGHTDNSGNGTHEIGNIITNILECRGHTPSEGDTQHKQQSSEGPGHDMRAEPLRQPTTESAESSTGKREARASSDACVIDNPYSVLKYSGIQIDSGRPPGTSRARRSDA
ncbi:hypothetical protein [Afipia felis]